MTPQDIDLIANLCVLGILGCLLAALAVMADMLPEPHA